MQGNFEIAIKAGHEKPSHLTRASPLRSSLLEIVSPFDFCSFSMWPSALAWPFSLASPSCGEEEQAPGSILGNTHKKAAVKSCEHQGQTKGHKKVWQKINRKNMRGALHPVGLPAEKRVSAHMCCQSCQEKKITHGGKSHAG
jgi:hypothetical protein